MDFSYRLSVFITINFLIFARHERIELSRLEFTSYTGFGDQPATLAYVVFGWMTGHDPALDISHSGFTNQPASNYRLQSPY